MKIRDEVKDFLKTNLNLELSMEKTKITHLGSQFAKFLGYNIRCSTLKKKQHISTRRMSRLGGIINTRKSTGKPKILVPINDLRNQLIKNGFANEKGFPKFMGKFIHLSDYEIVQRYNSILRGYMNFYNMAENR
jgi:Type II intron maturase